MQRLLSSDLLATRSPSSSPHPIASKCHHMTRIRCNFRTDGTLYGTHGLRGLRMSPATSHWKGQISGPIDWTSRRLLTLLKTISSQVHLLRPSRSSLLPRTARLLLADAMPLRRSCQRDLRERYVNSDIGLEGNEFNTDLSSLT